MILQLNPRKPCESLKKKKRDNFTDGDFRKLKIQERYERSNPSFLKSEGRGVYFKLNFMSRATLLTLKFYLFYLLP